MPSDDREGLIIMVVDLCPSDLKAENLTTVSEFYLLELSDDPEPQPVLFGIFLFMYLTTVLGNLLIILAVSSDPHLHTPMYFFLCNLSLADICFTSTTVPKMLVTLLSAYCGSTVFHGSKKLMVASLMYTVVSPMLNPFIYSLRNRDISRILRRLGSRILGTQDLG
ncbi:olfactory receptor 7D4-like [Thomomys bottae]